MKSLKFLTVLLCGALVVACNSNTEPVAQDAEQVSEETAAPEKVLTAKDYRPSAKEIKDVSYLLGINYGSFLKSYNFGDLNFNEMVKGMKDFLNAEGTPRDEDFAKNFRIDPNEMGTIIDEYLNNRQQYLALTNQAKEEEYLAKNAKKAGVQVTESGLQYEIIEAGSDVKATIDDTVSVTYKGTLLDGTVFDQNLDEENPISFPLNGVIAGWQEGIQLIGEGGTIHLVIPSKLAYGPQGNQSIPGNSTLIFDVKLIKVEKAETAEAPVEE